MKNRFSKIALSFVALVLLTQCGKDPDDFSIVPQAEWRGHEIEIIGNPTDNRKNIILQLYFTDRDGDIGIQDDQVSTIPCDFSTYSLFIKYFEKVGNSFVEVMPQDSCQPFHSNLPYLTPEGQNKVLEGDIFSSFSYLAFPKNLGVDSVKFEIQLRDRANHISNVVYSPAISILQ